MAGPAFNAGRYGIACGAVCKMVQDRLGISAVTGMYQEIPAWIFTGRMYTLFKPQTLPEAWVKN